MRLIGRLEIKDKYVIKPIQYEGLRKVGKPENIIYDFYKNKFDEILILNITGSLYGIDWVKNFVESILKKIFIPVTIGGGIKNLEQAKQFFDVGVDKVALNTSIIKDFSIVEKLKKEFGSQSVVCSIQANKIDNQWYAFTDMARKNSYIKVTDLIEKYSKSRVGEILVTSVRNDGTLKGVDQELIELCLKFTDVPIIYSGGLVFDDVFKLKNYSLDAVTVSSSYYYKNFSPTNFKKIYKET